MNTGTYPADVFRRLSQPLKDKVNAARKQQKEARKKKSGSKESKQIAEKNKHIAKLARQVASLKRKEEAGGVDDVSASTNESTSAGDAFGGRAEKMKKKKKPNK